VLCDRLLSVMLGEGAEDDVAVLAVRAHPAEGERPAEAGPEVLPGAARPPAQARAAAARTASAIAATPWSAHRIE
jgi:hypothetical protein